MGNSISTISPWADSKLELFATEQMERFNDQPQPLAVAEAPGPTGPSLPVEVRERIVEEVCLSSSSDGGGANRGWIRSLSALSLVSSGYTEICQRKLYEIAHIHPDNYSLDGVQYQRRNNTASFVSLMERSPHLGRYIKTLTITLPRGKKAIRILGAALLLVSKCLSCLAEVRIVDQDADEDSEDKTLRALDLLPDPKFGLKEWRKAASTDEWYTLSLALVSVARLAKSLFLKNLRVSGTFFTTCRQLENLALANVTLHSNRDWAYEPSDKALLVGRIPLKSLKLDAESLEDFGLVLDYAQIHDLFPIEFSHLEKLSLPVPIVERQSIRRDPIQADIMDLPIALKELHLWSISRIEPLTILQRMMGDMYTGQSTGFLQPPFVYFKGLDSPLRWLNTSSYETLTKLTFESRFRLCAKDDVIEDPYLGLFQGKSFAKLVQLEELVLTVWISGERYEEVNEAESFGNQWLVLDHAITPILDDNERTTTPHTHLRALKLTFGLRNICKKEDANHLFEVVSSMVFDRLHGLKALQKQGNIDLATECVAIADCPCGGAEPCDFHFREPRE